MQKYKSVAEEKESAGFPRCFPNCLLPCTTLRTHVDSWIHEYTNTQIQTYINTQIQFQRKQERERALVSLTHPVTDSVAPHWLTDPHDLSLAHCTCRGWTLHIFFCISCHIFTHCTDSLPKLSSDTYFKPFWPTGCDWSGGGTHFIIFWHILSHIYSLTCTTQLIRWLHFSVTDWHLVTHTYLLTHIYYLWYKLHSAQFQSRSVYGSHTSRAEHWVGSFANGTRKIQLKDTFYSIRPVLLAGTP